MSNMDRTITSINSIVRMGQQSYRRLPEKLKKQVLFLCFEKLVTRTMPEMKRIKSFLKTKSTDYLKGVLERERGPLELAEEDRMRKYQAIKKTATPQAMRLLDKLIKEYEGGKCYGYRTI